MKQKIVMKKKTFIPFFKRVTNEFMVITELKEGIYQTIVFDLLYRDNPIQGYKITTKAKKEALKNHLSFVSSLFAIRAEDKDVNLKSLKMHLSTF